MTRDKKLAYMISALISGLSLALLVLPIKYSIWQPICLLIPAMLAVCLLIKKSTVLSIKKRQVLLIVTLCVLLRILFHYLLGLYFGMGRRAVEFTWQQYLLSILSISLVIVPTEIIRGILLTKKYRAVSVMAYVIGVCSDILLISNLPSLTGFSQFMDVLGMTIMPAIVANALYQYLTARYGILPSLSMRLLLSLYPIFIPYITFSPDAIEAFGGLLLPVLIYVFISFLYERKKITHRRTSKLATVGTAVTIVWMLLVVMLISCQFRFGAIVIATPSMSGELNVGDVAIYEQYDQQVIEVDDIIIFKSGGSQIIHRVVNIENDGNELRYYTQGDANQDCDMGYRTSADIVGVVKTKVAYIGYPSIWLNSIFSNAT